MLSAAFHEEVAVEIETLVGGPVEQWTHERCKELKIGSIDTVLAAIAIHASHEEARKCIEYIKTNRDRMRYGEFHAAGLCTSTGVVESGCKRVVGVRLKHGGMFWTVVWRKQHHRFDIL